MDLLSHVIIFISDGNAWVRKRAICYCYENSTFFFHAGHGSCLPLCSICTHTEICGLLRPNVGASAQIEKNFQLGCVGHFLIRSLAREIWSSYISFETLSIQQLKCCILLVKWERANFLSVLNFVPCYLRRKQHHLPDGDYYLRYIIPLFCSCRMAIIHQHCVWLLHSYHLYGSYSPFRTVRVWESFTSATVLN